MFEPLTLYSLQSLWVSSFNDFHTDEQHSICFVTLMKATGRWRLTITENALRTLEQNEDIEVYY